MKKASVEMKSEMIIKIICLNVHLRNKIEKKRNRGTQKSSVDR